MFFVFWKIIWWLVLAFALSSCDIGSNVSVDTGPVGSGLAVIGIGLVLAAWIGACFGGGR